MVVVDPRGARIGIELASNGARNLARPPVNLLLLAFSGVRVVDPELAALGLTLPGFAERARVIAALPSLGLLTLAARAPEGVHVVYGERGEWPDSPEETADRIARERFDLVAISALTAVVDEAYVLADALRRRGVTVVLGGLHVSARSDEAAMHADAVVVGEGEAVFERVLADARRGELAPRYSASSIDAARAFDDGPLPRWDLMAGRAYDRVTVQTMRGCPLDCTFCGASRTIAPLRRKSLERIALELDAALAHAPHARIELADDNTFAARRDGAELVELLAARGARWFTETDLSIADDVDVLDRLAASGCAGLLIGLESPRGDRLSGVDSRDRKARWADEQHERVARVQERGVPVTGCFVVGLDTQGPEVFEETFEAVRALGLHEVQVTVATPFPGTRLRADLEHAGRIDARDTWDRCTLFDVAFTPAKMTRDELARGLRELVKALHAPDEVARRHKLAWSARRAALRTAREDENA